MNYSSGIFVTIGMSRHGHTRKCGTLQLCSELSSFKKGTISLPFIIDIMGKHYLRPQNRWIKINTINTDVKMFEIRQELEACGALLV